MKKWMGLLLAVVMVLCMVTTSFAETPAQQVFEAGDTWYYTKAGVKTENETFPGEDAVVKLSKTVASTGVENEFMVTLQVSTTQDITELHSDTPDAAVMLIMDVSNSMDDCDICGREASHTVHLKETTRTVYYCPDDSGKTYEEGRQGNRCEHCEERRRDHNAVQVSEDNDDYDHAYVSRLDKAQAAAVQFLDDFATKTGAEAGDHRWVAIVDFGSVAYTRLTWVDVTDPGNLTDAKDIINGLTVAHSGVNGVSDSGGTNIEGALMLGANVWGLAPAKDVDYKYTILLTDGSPTFHVNGESDNTQQINGSVGGSSSTSYDDAKDVGTQANRILSMSGLPKLYSICYGSVTQNNRTTYVWDDTPFDNWNQANPVTTDDMTIGEWLEAFSTKAFNGSAESGGTDSLFDSFNSVISQIQLAAAAWKVSDTMGEHVVWGGEVKESNVENQSSFTVADNELYWDVLSSSVDYHEETVGGTTYPVLSYTYKYKITLDNLDAAYKANTATDTNEKATLTFAVKNPETELWEVQPDVSFPKPQVKGYEGTLAFSKGYLDDGEFKPLEGVQFTLTSKDKSAEGVAWTATATSGANGVVSFTGIPSGHDYTLVESSHGDEFADPGAMPVTVALGDTSCSALNDKEQLINVKTDKSVTLVLKKAFGSDAHPDSIKFTVSNAAANYRNEVELSAANNWAVTLTGLTPGEYVITEQADYPGYDLTQSATLDGVAIDVTYNNVKPTLTLAENESHATYTVTFTNTYTQQVGAVSVKKSFRERSHDDLISGSTDSERLVELDESLYAAMEINVGLVNADGKMVAEVWLNSTNNWSESFENLPVGTYTIEETIEGAIPDHDFIHLHVLVDGEVSSDNKITVGQNSEIKLLLENHYTHQMGNIRVLKTLEDIDDSAIPADHAFLVDVYATTLKADGTYEKTDDLVTTISVEKHGDDPWSGTSGLLPVGVYYLVERETSTAVDGYNFISGVFNEQFVTVHQSPSTVSVQLTNTYEQQRGTLKVTKQFDIPTDYQANFAYPKSITVQVLNDNDSGNVVETLTLTQDNGWTASTTLPLGSYHLAEIVAENVDGTADVKDFGLTATWSPSSAVSITSSNYMDAFSYTVKNTYTKDYGSVTISKAFNDVVPEDLKSKATIVFVIYEQKADGTMGSVVESITLPDTTRGAWNKTIHLPVGNYYLFEYGAHNAFENYTLTGVTINNTTWYEDSMAFSDVKGYAFTVEKEETITLKAVNTYEKDTASLTIKKAFATGSELQASDFEDKSIDVQIRHGNETVRTVTLNKDKNWSETVTGLDVGVKYTLVEVTWQDGDNTAYRADYDLAYSWDGGEEVTLTKDASVTRTVTNTYTKKTGSLTVRKHFEGVREEDIPLLESVSITVTVTPEGATDSVQTITLNKGNHWTSKITLPVGTYELAEETIGIEGYTHQGTAFTSDTVEIKADQTMPVDVTVTNTMVPDLGQLTITKKFAEGSALDADDFTAINVLVKRNGSLYQTVTLSASDNWSVTLTDVPTGTYTVEEVTAADAANTAHVDDYGLHVTYTNHGSVDVTKDAEATMHVTNDYTQEVGYIRVRKTFTQDADSLAAEKSIPSTGIAIYVRDPQGNLEETAYVSRTNGGSVLIGPLPVGEYVLAEEVGEGVDGSAYVEGYKLISTWPETDGKVTVTNGNTAEATVNNQYTRGMGSLTVTKVFEGCTDITKPSIIVCVKQGETTVRTLTLNPTNNWTATVTDLPAGDYTVVEDETSAAVVNHSLVEVSYSEDGKAVVSSEAAAEVTITNTYAHEKGSLTITKAFANGSVLGPDHFEAINVLVKRDGAEYATVTLPYDNEWSVTLENVPAGNYTVEEVTAPNAENTAYRAGYGLNVSYNGQMSGEVSVTNAVPATMTITNRYDNLTGSLTINKAFQGPQYLYPASVEFTVTGAGFSRKLTLSAENGWTATLGGLLAGEYTVTESVQGGSGYSVATTWSSPDGRIRVYPGRNAALTCTNVYQEMQALSIRIPVEKTVTLAGDLAPGKESHFSFGAAWQGGGNVSVRFENDPGNTQGVFMQTSADTYSVTVSEYGTVKGCIVIEGYAEDLAGFRLQTWEKLTGYASAEAAEADGWIFDETATDGAVVWNIQLGYNDYGNIVASIARTDGQTAAQVSYENIYTSTYIPPQTGDGENLALWIALCAISALGVMVLITRHRRNASVVVK